MNKKKRTNLAAGCLTFSAVACRRRLGCLTFSAVASHFPPLPHTFRRCLTLSAVDSPQLPHTFRRCLTLSAIASHFPPLTAKN
jgi:hypothetical protein